MPSCVESNGPKRDPLKVNEAGGQEVHFRRKKLDLEQGARRDGDCGATWRSSRAARPPPPAPSLTPSTRARTMGCLPTRRSSPEKERERERGERTVTRGARWVAYTAGAARCRRASGEDDGWFR